VRAVLHRPLYRGEIVWGATKQGSAFGSHVFERQPQERWTVVHDEALRIVDDRLWADAHSRLASSRKVYLRGTNGRLGGKPPSGVTSRYLLSGQMACSACGASLTVRSRRCGRGRWFYFVCSSYDHRGSCVCANGTVLPMEDADIAVLERLEDDILDVDVITGAIDDAVEQLRPSAAETEAKRSTLRDDLQRRCARAAPSAAFGMARRC
jgi:hypothetical protein